MSVQLTCRNCGQSLTASDIDTLLPIMQDHVDAHASNHGVPRHALSREQLAARLDRTDEQSG